MKSPAHPLPEDYRGVCCSHFRFLSFASILEVELVEKFTLWLRRLRSCSPRVFCLWPDFGEWLLLVALKGRNSSLNTVFGPGLAQHHGDGLHFHTITLKL